MNIALVEFNPFHDECLYSQIRFIKSRSNNKVFLIFNHKLKSRLDFWQEIDGHKSISSNQWIIGYFGIVRYLKKNKIDVVVFNTVHSPQVYSLLKYSSFLNCRFYGLVHDLKDLTMAKSKLLDNKLCGYFLLNDFLVERAREKNLTSIKLASFYSIFFPETSISGIEKKEEEIWVAIPGLMEPWRRDYQRLIDALKINKLEPHVKLLFLGKSTDRKGKRLNLRTEIENLSSGDQFLFWDGFIEPNTFHAYLRMSDYLLPLLHQATKAGERYKDKITGLYNLGFSHGKRFIMEDFLSSFADFRSTALFYSSDDDLVEVLIKLAKPDGVSPYTEDKFSFNFQCGKYNDFIESAN